MIPKLPETIDELEMDELRALHGHIESLSHIPFEQVLATNYLITPLRRTLQATKRAAANFQLTPPPAPSVNGNAPSASSLDRPAQRAAVLRR